MMNFHQASLHGLCLAISMVMLFQPVFTEEEHHIKVGPPASLIRDRTHIQDRDHIREHLDGIIDIDGIPESEMTEKQLQLHYFKLHDYDHNNRLDGLELLNAMTHYHHDGAPNAEPLKEDDLMNLIDPILRDDDKNKDGYIDYVEYAATQS
ncbi:multiple coagulation factor deficiency protein 2 homolog isoform X2 [Lytechinus variegatus]|uniref:multiple coagulation factor deficiency protein 2 homolog isoform X2 n=1 Tax=Lytechinus variegatus TaxID=7654 RepID=UPI001BB27EF4|nr:multiple coagulation factor deficiency protein 2 homolog isoform X2 [Lytechinus variegatus]